MESIYQNNTNYTIIQIIRICKGRGGSLELSAIQGVRQVGFHCMRSSTVLAMVYMRHANNSQAYALEHEWRAFCVQ